MPEFDYFNGENFITFDLIEIDDEKCEVTVAVSDTGRISIKTFDLLFDGNRRYFEYYFFNSKSKSTELPLSTPSARYSVICPSKSS